MRDHTSERAAYTERFERRIKEALRDFRDIELEQMGRGEVEARARLVAWKGSIHEKRVAAQERPSEARHASAAAWSEARAGVEAAWVELRDAVARARIELLGDGRRDDEDRRTA